MINWNDLLKNTIESIRQEEIPVPDPAALECACGKQDFVLVTEQGEYYDIWCSSCHKRVVNKIAILEDID